jgi:cyclohexyl-isocyanide hydratase
VREIAMLMYPGFFAQDLVGPYTVFASLLNTRVHLIAPTRDPIVATPGEFAILPTGTLADCPHDLDLLLVPGGAMSTVQAMEDEMTVAFVREFGARAKYLTSVCTGSMILGAAGLLKGCKATSHWVTHDLLAQFGAIPTHGRFVVDGRIITGGGVTAGIDFGLKVASILDSEETAQLVQLAIEYDPKPPYDSGSPERAPARIKAMADKNYAPFREAMRSAVERIARRAG